MESVLVCAINDRGEVLGTLLVDARLLLDVHEWPHEDVIVRKSLICITNSTVFAVKETRCRASDLKKSNSSSSIKTSDFLLSDRFLDIEVANDDIWVSFVLFTR